MRVENIVVVVTLLSLAFAVASSISVDSSGNLRVELLSSESTISNLPLEETFESWKETHRIDFLPAENLNRFEIFKSNLKFIEDHNSNPLKKFHLALNKFAHLTREEFKSRYLGLRVDLSKRVRGANSRTFRYANVAPEESRDWRKEGAVTPPKNQEQCGSCWAFSTTGSIEGINKIMTGELLSLSEQELVDCDTEQDMGCNGGLMDNAFAFVIKNGGLDTESDYPYTATDNECNAAKENKRVVAIDGFEDVPENDEIALQKAVYMQPVSVAIDADAPEFQFYKRGIMDMHCDTSLDHGVLAVGYGSEGGEPYWIVKNSWGTEWGEGGFFRLVRNTKGVPEGECGIAMMASYPTKDGEPSPSPSPSPPEPPPEPLPVKCDRKHSCDAGQTCCCSVPIAKFCLAWACCPVEKATCCPDRKHCCPPEYPVCEAHAGICSKGGEFFDFVPMLQKAPAKVDVGVLDFMGRVERAFVAEQ